MTQKQEFDLEFEELTVKDAPEGHKVSRARVPGGWIYAMHKLSFVSPQPTPTIVFIPDPGTL